MSELLILTNNPLVVSEDVSATVQLTDKSGLEPIFQEALNLVQSGYVLLSAPLPPNVPLTRAPYRTLVLRKNVKQYDVAGIKALEKAKERLTVLGCSVFNEQQAADAAYIDRELLRRSLDEIRQAELGYTQLT